MKTSQEVRLEEKIEKYKAVIFSLTVTFIIITTLLISIASN